MDQTGWKEADLAALGRVVVNFSAIDRSAEQILLTFIRTGPTPILVVAGEDIRKKLETCGSALLAMRDRWGYGADIM
jgi:hypothetical protein